MLIFISSLTPLLFDTTAQLNHRFMGRRQLHSGHGKPTMDKEMSKFWTSMGFPLQVYVK